jgi:ABC-type sugar transport system ATPase subunit
VGSLLADPELPPLGAVRDLFTVARRLRGGEASRETWFEALGLDALQRVPVARLDIRQRRSVALGLALAVPDPVLLVLHEPLANLTHASAPVLTSLLRKRGDRGCCVLVLTASVHDAAAVADDSGTLVRGRLGRAVGRPDADALAPDQVVEMHVWADLPRALASSLMLEAAIHAVQWSGADSPVVVRGRSLDLVASTIAETAAANGVRIQGLQPQVPVVDVRAEPPSTAPRPTPATAQPAEEP